MRLLPWPSRRTVARIEREVDKMATNQERLDTTVSAIAEDLGTIKVKIPELQAEIQALKDAAANGEQLDWSRADALVADIEAVAHPPAGGPETPGEPTPEPETPAF